MGRRVIFHEVERRGRGCDTHWFRAFGSLDLVMYIKWVIIHV